MENEKLKNYTINLYDLLGALIEYGQHDKQFKLGDIIKYDPVSVVEIAREFLDKKTKCYPDCENYNPDDPKKINMKGSDCVNEITALTKMDMNIYDCPIHEQIGQLKTMMANEHDKMIMKAVQEIGIEIDQESLVQAIRNDRQRYEEAYKKGYSDCQKEYEEKMKHIANITGYRMCDEKFDF